MSIELRVTGGQERTPESHSKTLLLRCCTVNTSTNTNTNTNKYKYHKTNTMLLNTVPPNQNFTVALLHWTEEGKHCSTLFKGCPRMLPHRYCIFDCNLTHIVQLIHCTEHGFTAVSCFSRRSLKMESLRLSRPLTNISWSQSQQRKDLNVALSER